MKQLSIFLFITGFALIFLCNAQDGPFEIPKPEIPPLKNEIPYIPPIQFQTIPPIIINPSILCLIFPLPARCNPCKYGQPLTISCGDGTQKCAASGGTCKVNQYDKAYCCPNEHRGCCPPPPPVIIPLPPVLPLCIPTCLTDAQCKDYQKCCGNCLTCVNATLI